MLPDSPEAGMFLRDLASLEHIFLLILGHFDAAGLAGGVFSRDLASLEHVFLLILGHFDAAGFAVGTGGVFSLDLASSLEHIFWLILGHFDAVGTWV